MAKRYLSPEEFCQLTGWSDSTVRRRLKYGSLPAVQPGGPRTMWLIDAEAFQNRQQDCAHGAAAPQIPNQQPSADQQADQPRPVARLPGPRPGWQRGRLTPRMEEE